MSSTAAHIHPLVAQLREELNGDATTTHQAAADAIGVSLRTLTYWMNTDVVPQKRQREQITSWLAKRARRKR